MTDARLPETILLDRRFSSLTASEWRSYTHSLMWSVSNRTDGYIAPHELKMIPLFGTGDEQALVKIGVWEETDRGTFYIKRFHLEQTTRERLEQLEHKRSGDRERQRRHRAKGGGPDDPPGQSMVTEDVTRDVRATTEDRTGQARTGEDSSPPESQDFDPATGEVLDPPGLSLVSNVYAENPDEFDAYVESSLPSFGDAIKEQQEFVARSVGWYG